MKMENIENILKSYLAPIAQFTILFGSFVTDRFNDRSDIDCAVFFDNKLSFEDRTRITGELEDIVGREIDLICLNQDDIIITMQALANGKVLFVHDICLYHLYKARKITEYLDFKLSRKIIEDALLGRVA
ncbi:MAG TPA: nucleotidyltransferase domain-containing protein [Chitinispirillaceae bacterium]|nr:nucleotidyltransferase domain-containing protein [Chitinispirillaceae bacterium]